MLVDCTQNCNFYCLILLWGFLPIFVWLIIDLFTNANSVCGSINRFDLEQMQPRAAPIIHNTAFLIPLPEKGKDTTIKTNTSLLNITSCPHFSS